jgi:hypothetical protein
VKRLRKAGKSVDEAMTEIRASWYKGQGPLHMAALSGKTAVCKLLIKDLKLDVDAAVYDGKFVFLLWEVFGFVGVANAIPLWYLYFCYSSRRKF